MRENITVRDIIGMEYVGVSESDTVEAAAELMLEEDADTVVVLRGREPVGMLTCRDALSTLLTDDGAADRPVSEVMSETAPRITTLADVDEAADVMFSEPTSRLFVFDDGEFVGLLTEREVMAATSSRAVDRGFDAEANEPELRADGSEVEAEVSEFSTQSICEVCGSLVRDLSNMNGQLICADCREV
ncbi:CBS domain-containing protein [Halogranum amylolyticum]|uniref:CBS domain-containing protein n=1 Tax=Halogranum amylolyticum TaxID=660520 RepID=A0A1H8S0G3_9EURY|nr:CBS domain-containing protein [Halogranum amylolyticum]SEO72026.1 CBS domain-containing protein [Halogranum amylolyticum]